MANETKTAPAAKHAPSVDKMLKARAVAAANRGVSKTVTFGLPEKAFDVFKKKADKLGMSVGAIVKQTLLSSLEF